MLAAAFFSGSAYSAVEHVAASSFTGGTTPDVLQYNLSAGSLMGMEMLPCAGVWGVCMVVKRPTTV